MFAVLLLSGVALTAAPVGAAPLADPVGRPVAAAASEGVARAAASAPASFKLKNLETGKCLEVWAGVWTGAAVYVTDCSGSPSQSWSQNGLQLQNAVQGICLDLYNWNNFDGAPVLVWECTGKPNQNWEFYGSQIRSLFSYRCLTVYPANTATGPLVVTANCTGKPNQSWAVV
ncbi:RICIN domain-containing protein [Micromonospora sp. RTGN7]|uniref:RICIN domain-containing protein n=1 Tax=Micromonospora sp. RTGN7 TaxID=3016526 RepID=UPI0029FF1115|nr:RICIN domain-containing protein [Micromonospora sp. RTGN7]